MNKLIFTLILFFCSITTANQIKVGVIDTGLGAKMESVVPLCETGHAAVTGPHPIATKYPPSDKIGHGSHVSHLIEQSFRSSILSEKSRIPSSANMLKSPYCQVIVRVWTDAEENSVDQTAIGIRYLIDQKVDIINISGGGYIESEEETLAIKKALDLGIVVVAAAGNEGTNIDEEKYYPAASDPRVIVVGSLGSDGKPAKYSNTGSIIDVWVRGTGYAYNSDYGKLFLKKMRGTSMSTAIVTGKIIQNLLKERKNESTKSVTRNKKTKGSGVSISRP